MDFSPYQQNGKFTSPNTNYTEPLRVHADNSGGMALAKQGGLAMPLLKGYLSYKETVDNVKSMEANNEYNRLMSEGTVQLMQRKEEKAVNILEDYDKLHQKTLETVRKKYGSYINYGNAAIAFNNYTTRDNATRRANMMKYQLSETDKWQETQFNNSLATCNQMVLDGGGTDEAIEEASERMATLVQGRYANYGNDKIKEQERLLKGELVSSALSLAMKMEDYPRMGQLATKYAQYLTPQARISVLSMYGKRQRDARDMAQSNDLFSMLGENATRDDYKNAILQGYASKDEIGKRFSHYESLLGEEMPNGRNGCVEGFLALTKPFFKFSQDNESEVNVGSVCRLAQQSDGVKIERYHGGEIPEGAGIIYFSEGDDITDFDNAEHITMSDGNGGFYGNSSSAKDYEDESGNYVRGNGCIIHSEDKEIGGYQIGYVIRMDEQTAREMSDLEAEEKTDKMWARHQKRVGEIHARRNAIIKQGRLCIQDLFNNDIEDEAQYRAVINDAWENSGYNDEVRITLETDVNNHLKALQKAREEQARAEARAAGGRARGGSGNGGEKAKSDPELLYNLEHMYYNGFPKEHLQRLILEGNYTASDTKAALKELDELFGDKPNKNEMSALRRDFAGICYETMGISTKKSTNENGEVIPADPEAQVMMTIVMNNVYDKIVRYRRDNHYDPTQSEIAQFVRDESALVTINRASGEKEDNGFSLADTVHDAVESLFGKETADRWLGDDEESIEILTPKLRDAGIMNTPYKNERTGAWVVETKRGMFEITDEQLERILDGERIEKVLPMAFNPEADA